MMLRVFTQVLLVLVVMAGPSYAIEPETREVVVTHNRVWDGDAYQENFIPSDTGEMWLLPNYDNAISFVRTLEYYWPLARQKYVAFERLREELTGTLQISQDGRILAEIEAAPYVVVYPNGAVNGDARLLWGEAATEAFADHQQAERDFVQEFTAAKRAHSRYERALLEAGAARIAGQDVQDVPPPPPLPEPSLRLVTEPGIAFRVNLEPGKYQMVVVQDGVELGETRETLHVTDGGMRDVVVANVIPEERWTRPLPANTSRDRVFMRPGSVFYATLDQASEVGEAEFTRITRPQSAFVEGRRTYVTRRPNPQDEAILEWRVGTPEPLTRTALKVDQTRGSDYGYVVRAATEGESSDIDAFVVSAPNGARRGTLSTETGFQREIVVVRPRLAGLSWGLALLPLVIGLGLSVLRRGKWQA